MKTTLKYAAIGLFVLFTIVIVLGNIGQIYVSKKKKEYSQTLEGMIAEINEQLPYKVGNNFYFKTIDKVILKDNNVIYEFTLDPTLFYPIRESTLPESLNGVVLVFGNRNCALDLDTLISNYLVKKGHRAYLLYYHLFVKSSNPNKVYEEIVKRKCSQTWRMRSPFSDRQYETTMTYKELTEVGKFCKNNPDKALQEFMFEYLERQNRVLDIASNNADITMHLVDDGSSLIFSSKFNKPIYNSIKYLKANQDEMSEALQEDFQLLPFFNGMKEICERTNRGFLFRYLNWNKTDSVDFNIIIQK